MTSQIKDEEDDLHFSEAGKTFYKIRFRRASPDLFYAYLGLLKI